MYMELVNWIFATVKSWIDCDKYTIWLFSF